MIKLVKKNEEKISPTALRLTKSSWRNMKQRAKRECIFLDQRFASFADFLSHMGPRTSRKFTIDRKDYAGPYSPENCRWADKATQALNRSNAVKLTHGGETLPLLAWADRLKVAAATLRRRRRLGWSDSEIITGSRSHAGKPSTDWPWPAGDEQQWERAYAAYGKPGEARESFLRRVCSERYMALTRMMIRPAGDVEPEVIGVDEETGEPLYKSAPLPPGFHEHLERVKRMLADAELKCAAAARRSADPFAHLFFKPESKA